MSEFEPLNDWLLFLGTGNCTCAYRWLGSYGLLYGQSMGPGWVRTTTEPGCPHHGKEAS